GFPETRNLYSLARVLDDSRRRDYVGSRHDFLRDCGKRVSETGVAAEFLKYDEDKNIERDDDVVNVGERGSVCVVVVERKDHRCSPSVLQKNLRIPIPLTAISLTS